MSKIDFIFFFIGMLIGAVTVAIGIFRLFSGYDFLTSLMLANVGVCAFGIAYLAFCKWVENNKN